MSSMQEIDQLQLEAYRSYAVVFRETANEDSFR